MEGSVERRTGVWTWIGVGVALAAVTAFHYLTSPEAGWSHNIYRRLYYLPIVWAAFAWGWRGGLVTALLATVAYLPHAFFMHHHLDPAPVEDKALEIVLYFGVGLLAGSLVDRERRARRREARRALAQLEAEARAERSAGLVQLSQGLANEIRNPLGGLQGAIEILADAVPAEDPRREMITVAVNETERLGKVLGDFLEFARPGEPDPRPFEAAEPIRHVAGLMRAEASKRRVELKVEVEQQARALADPEQVAQVLMNLVRNALQATPAGGKVTLGLRSAGSGQLEFLVSDTGPGVPDELGDTIYDPYVTGREDGTGLGLSISTLLVRQNKGTLRHERNRAGGATFFFTLPAAPGGEP